MAYFQRISVASVLFSRCYFVTKCGAHKRIFDYVDIIVALNIPNYILVLITQSLLNVDIKNIFESIQAEVVFDIDSRRKKPFSLGF